MDTLHATCVLIGTAGVLIRGTSGSGKTALALALVDAAGRAGRFARLVADDRVAVRAVSGRLVASPPGTIAGLAEIRGRGLVPQPFERAAVIRLAVDLLPPADLARLPDADAFKTVIAGVALPRQPVPIGDLPTAQRLTEAALAAVPAGD
jgi:serine kinase of HPr protein (carbohydrate metabolism regulator)